MKVADVIRVIKDADVMTPYKVDLRVSVVEKCARRAQRAACRKRYCHLDNARSAMLVVVEDRNAHAIRMLS